MIPTILLDCDGILTHTFVDYAVDFARRNGVPHATAESISDFNIFKVWGKPELWKPFTEHVARPGMVANMVPAPGAAEAVENLRSFARVVCVTSPNDGCPHWFEERKHWLKQHFHFSHKEVMQVHSKSMVVGDLLIDDAEHNCSEFHDAGRACVLVSQPWNAHASKFKARAVDLQHAVAVAGYLLMGQK